MPDDLRTRIVAVWLQHDGPYSEYRPDADLTVLVCDCGWVGETDEYKEYAQHFADVLIRELGLTQQWLSDGIISDGEPRPWELPCETRYATEWERFDG